MALGKGLDSLIPQKPLQQKPVIPVADESPRKPIGTNEILIAEVQINPHQPRKRFDPKELEELVASIKEYGVIQPIVVTEVEGGGYQLIAGERRLRASKIAGKTSIPAVIRTAGEQEKMELALIENIQRKNLNALEEAIAYARLLEEFDLTQEEASKRIGKSRSSIANTLRLLSLPEDIQQAIMQEEISEGHARALAGLEDEAAQRELLQKIKANKLSVRETEGQVREVSVKSHKRKTKIDPVLMEQEEQIRDALGTPVSIKRKGESGEIKIRFSSLEDFRSLFEKLTSL